MASRAIAREVGVVTGIVSVWRKRLAAADKIGAFGGTTVTSRRRGVAPLETGAAQPLSFATGKDCP
jgi:hypothetical protein